MKIKNIQKSLILIVTLNFTASSCADWLKVDMEDGIMEDKLFSENEGFFTVLNGAYSSLNESYGNVLSMGVIDVMAQYYNVPANGTHPYKIYANYSYQDKSFETTSSTIWKHLYGLIANINVLIEHCDEPESALSARYYPIVKGEALALRAMIHFDLLRLYGPIYSSQTESSSAIPYLDVPNNKDIVPILSAKEVCGKILRDLNEAAELLKDDPVRTDGVQTDDAEENPNPVYLRYRQYRLNYYAVQGLLARLYMWMGNKTDAYNCVTTLLAEVEEKQTFPWVTKAAATSTSAPDRVFSTEVMFGLYNPSRGTLFDGLFGKSLEGDALTFVGGLSGDDSKLAQFYGPNSSSDYRRKMWEEVVTSTDEEAGVSTGITYSLKYEQITTDDYFKFMIPLMRISEMYLIQAECSNNLEEVQNCLHQIRWNRNLTSDEVVTEENKDQLITEEFAREVIGEGQLFFYYKRHAMEEFASGTDVTNTYKMLLSNYVVPLPKSETDNRQ